MVTSAARNVSAVRTLLRRESWVHANDSAPSLFRFGENHLFKQTKPCVQNDTVEARLGRNVAAGCLDGELFPTIGRFEVWEARCFSAFAAPEERLHRKIVDACGGVAHLLLATLVYARSGGRTADAFQPPRGRKIAIGIERLAGAVRTYLEC